MALTFQKAKRIQAKIKIAIGGPSGSGKTMSSLLLAYGLIKAEHPDWTDEQIWDKICICDTENSSGSLYVGARAGAVMIGEYNTIPIEPPFEEQTLIDCIAMCENHGMEVIIIDSATAFWQGSGGALETQGKIAERAGNSFSSWRGIKADQQKMMQAILQSKCHVISAYRAKTEYVQEKNDKGKTIVKNIGMGIIAEGNTEYEYSTFFLLDANHNANTTKDRTGLFDGQYFVITPDTGRKIYEWLSSGAPAEKPTVPTPQKANHPLPPNEPSAPAPSDADRVAKAIAAIDPLIVAAAKEDKEATKEKVMAIAGTANYKALTDLKVLTELYNAFKPQ